MGGYLSMKDIITSKWWRKCLGEGHLFKLGRVMDPAQCPGNARRNTRKARWGIVNVWTNWCRSRRNDSSTIAFCIRFMPLSNYCSRGYAKVCRETGPNRIFLLSWHTAVQLIIFQVYISGNWNTQKTMLPRLHIFLKRRPVLNCLRNTRSCF